MEDGAGDVRNPLARQQGTADGSTLAESDLVCCLGSHPELRAVIEDWGALPTAVRAGIMAMIRAVKERPTT